MAANSLKATLPSLQSTKVPREHILMIENDGEKIFPRSALHTSICLLSAASSLWSISRSTPGELPAALFEQAASILVLRMIENEV